MARRGKLPEFYNNLTNTMEPGKNKNRISSATKAVRNLSSKVNTQTKLENKPSNNEGITGDKKLVKDGTRFYLYYKIEKEWFKTELERG